MTQHLTEGRVTPEFGALMLEAAALWPRTGKLAEAQVRAYASALSGHAIADVRRAFDRIVRKGGAFFPAAGEVLAELEPAADERGVLAWVRFRRAATVIGAHASVTVDDPVAAWALRDVFGSWPAFCAMEDGPALTLRRQEFLVAYRAWARRVPLAFPAVRLAGLCEAAGGYRGGAGVLAGRMPAQGEARLLPDGPPLPALPPLEPEL